MIFQSLSEIRLKMTKHLVEDFYMYLYINIITYKDNVI